MDVEYLDNIDSQSYSQLVQALCLKKTYVPFSILSIDTQKNIFRPNTGDRHYLVAQVDRRRGWLQYGGGHFDLPEESAFFPR